MAYRLTDTRSITRILSNVINQLLAGEGMQNNEIQRMRAICYACSIGLNSLQQGDLEKRLEALEKTSNNRRAG